MNNKSRTIEVVPSLNISEFKKLIEDKTGIPPHEMTLLYAGKPVFDKSPNT